MTIQDIIRSADIHIGDTSTDRLSAADRFLAVTEATAWLLEELGNEHMVDRAEVEFLPTVTWYKMDSLTPYLLTAGQLRFKEETNDKIDFTRIEARDLDTMTADKYAYAIERYGNDSYLGIKMPEQTNATHKDLIGLNESDTLTYTGTNASNIYKETDAVRFDMTATGVTSTGIETTSQPIDVTDYVGLGILVFEVEIPNTTDVTSVTLKFGTNLTTDYWLGTVTQDINGNALSVGVNTIKIKWLDLTVVGSPSVSNITRWQFRINHLSSKPAVDGLKLSDLRITKPLYLNFKYIFFRVGNNSTGTELTEFTASTDVPFFSERYPQYRFAVAHKAAAILYRGLQLYPNARSHEKEALSSLERYRKNFSGERDMGSSNFKVAGINFRSRRVFKRR